MHEGAKVGVAALPDAVSGQQKPETLWVEEK